MTPPALAEAPYGTTWDSHRAPALCDVGTQWSEVRPVTTADWLSAATEKLREFGRYAPNWDSYGSPPVQALALSSATVVLVLFKAWHPRSELTPHIAPTPGGGIHIEWGSDEQGLEINVHPNGALAFLAIEDDEAAGDGWIQDPAMLKEQYDRLH